MAVLFGVDVSDYQGVVDANLLAADGVEFEFIKATEGASWKAQYFAGNLQRARDAGRLVAAYHYVRADASAADQVANVVSVVPRDVPVIPDVETNSGGVALLREVVDRLRAAGYVVPVTYIPRWYWQQIGSPDLTGLPPLWSSHYPDNVVGSLAGKWAQIPASYWDGYGGLPVAILQFTSSASVGGRSPLDANAFQGTRDELAALLHQGVADMFEQPDRNDVKQILNQLMGPWPSKVPGAPKEAAFSLVDWALMIDKNVFAQGAQISGLVAAVAASTTNPAITPEFVQKTIQDAVAQHIQITGTVNITPAPPAAPKV